MKSQARPMELMVSKVLEDSKQLFLKACKLMLMNLINILLTKTSLELNIDKTDKSSHKAYWTGFYKACQTGSHKSILFIILHCAIWLESICHLWPI